jgi:hypothetical protein
MGTAHLYADELGISFRRLRVLGGEARLRAMSPDALSVMLKPSAYGSKGLQRGLKARGMRPSISKRNPSIYRSQAERVA